MRIQYGDEDEEDNEGEEKFKCEEGEEREEGEDEDESYKNKSCQVVKYSNLGYKRKKLFSDKGNFFYEIQSS